MPEVRLNHSIPTTRFTTNNANSLSSSHSSSVDSPNEENDDSTVSCLICIDSIQRSQPIWTCQQCKCLFHLPCIQTWVREGIAAQKASSVSLPSLHESLSISTHSSSSSSSSKAKPASYLWNCPKCRLEYNSVTDFPNKYTCFCGKTTDPVSSPWLAPHSCGEICELPLTPLCGHKCLQPCHSGFCPPCPKTLSVKCFCGKQSSTKRCSNRDFSCGNTCGKLLACKSHYCSNTCHSGPCQPCDKVSTQDCGCKRTQSERPCAEPQFKCTYSCGKVFECGVHTCDRVCHSGPCGVCPKSLPRTCPCGKVTTTPTSCLDSKISTCKDTCNKLLECQRHNCAQLCHVGPCDRCRHMIDAYCRCKSTKKTVQCFQSEFTCEKKCANTRNCGRHACKKKCCVECPPCEEVCNRKLSCGQHRCNAVCHSGPCYPCPLLEKVTCACGKTEISVPCGSAKFTKPPKCKNPCLQPSSCHHAQQPVHNCHQGLCPKCDQICGQEQPNCKHSCQAKCHSWSDSKAVLASTFSSTSSSSLSSSSSSSSAWQHKPTLPTVTKASCPPCTVPVFRECYGEHETTAFPCSEVRDFQCGRVCGRELSCGNHTCQTLCHKVKKTPFNEKPSFSNNSAVSNFAVPSPCPSCELPCIKPRPLGCNHPCKRFCHNDECSPCKQFVKLKCHCDMVSLHIFCEQICSKTKELLDKPNSSQVPQVTTPEIESQVLDALKSCQNDCPKKMTCGHACQKLCHSGDCSNSLLCNKKVSVRCDCKRIKQDRICSDVQKWQEKNANKSIVPCDDECQKIIEQKQQQQLELERQEKLKEELEKQKEQETSAKSFNGKKLRKRKEYVEPVEEPYWKKNIWVIVSIVAFIVSLILIFLIWRRKTAKY